MHSKESELFENYELLLPPKNDGGHLLLTLHQRIQANQLSEQFSSEDIRLILEELAGEGVVPQTERIIRQLLHYQLRQVPEQYGKFELSDHAIRLVELMRYRIDNPYKDYPLKETFEKYFFIRSTDLKTIIDLELKFGREFTAGHKRIINDHLASLEDELAEAYQQLKEILTESESNATVMVRKFTEVFKKFGERASDITYAISSKDFFLRRLRERVERFYVETELLKQAQTDDDINKLKQYQKDWLSALAIQEDLELFFKGVDRKLDRIRRQILRASVKLRELQESFSKSSNFRSLVGKLFHLYIEQESAKRLRSTKSAPLPLKSLIYEKVQLVYPVHYDFGVTRNVTIKTIQPDLNYELSQKKEIEREILRQEIINRWVEKGKANLSVSASLDITNFMKQILEEQDDFFIAQSVAIDLLNFASEFPLLRPSIKTELYEFVQQNVSTWRMTIH